MYDIVVIGAGPAGLTAATYAARAGKKVIVLEKSAFGGQIATSPRVENFPSVMEISGSELADKMTAQAMSHGVEFDMGTAAVKKIENGFNVVTEYGEYPCRAVIIAAGVSHKRLGIESEKKFAGKGVYYCAVCDGAFCKDKEVAVVGDGNSAVQYALYLSAICKKVYLLTLFDKLFADKEIADRLCAAPSIEWIKNVSVTEIEGSDSMSGVTFKSSDDGSVTFLDAEALFVAIGQVPDNQLFAPLTKLDEKGFIMAGEDCRTSSAGIFAAGDCRTKTVRQCTTAVGDGATAAVNACAYIDGLS